MDDSIRITKSEVIEINVRNEPESRGEIQSLIQKTDQLYKKPGREIRLRLTIPFLPALFILIPVLILEIITSFGRLDLQTTLAEAAVAVAVATLAYQFAQDYSARYLKLFQIEIYRRLERETTDHILLRALISLRASVDPIELVELHSSNPDLFERKRLVERLIE